jgi:uncharacterized membrane protein
MITPAKTLKIIMKNTLYSAIYILHALDKKIQHKHQKSKKANVYSYYFLHPRSKKAKQYVKTYTYINNKYMAII